MVIATAFYLLTSFEVVVALPWQDAAASSRPLTDALNSILVDLGLSSGFGSAPDRDDAVKNQIDSRTHVEVCPM